MKIKLFDCLKIGFGFYFGYEIAHKVNDILGVVYPVIRDRIKNGY